MDCVDDIIRVVEECAEVNHAQLVGAQHGTVILPTYNWADYFEPHFKQTTFKEIKVMHHVTFQATFWKSIHVREELCGHTGGDKHFEKPRMVTGQRGASSSCPSSWPFNGIEDVSL